MPTLNLNGPCKYIIPVIEVKATALLQ